MNLRDLPAKKRGYVKHGLCGTPEYRSWAGMIQRTTNKNDKNYHQYGGRGISVCSDWINSFDAFLADVGKRPSTEHTIDRYPDNNGNYESSNVRWATQKEQLRNRRNNRLLTYNGVTLCIGEWAETLGISRHVLYGRIRRNWSVEKTLETIS